MHTHLLTWRRQRHPSPVLLPGKSHGRRSLVGYSPWGHKESDTTEQLPFHFSLSCIGEGNDNSLQCSCLENPRDGGAWWAAIYGVTQSRTQLKWLSSSSSSIAEKKMNFRIETLIRPVCPQRYGKMWSCVSAVFLASTVSHWSITNSVDVIPIFTYVCSSASWLTFIAVVICYCCLFILSCAWSILIIEILLYLRHCQL